MNELWRILIVSVLAVMLAGCSIGKAARGERMKDLSVLSLGTHRHTVVAELDKPLLTEKQDGKLVDIYKIVQGQHGSVKFGKALLYGGMAFFTLGLSEFVTNPIEDTASGAEMQFSITYNEDNRIEAVRVFRDDRWVPVHDLGRETRGKTISEEEEASGEY